MVQSGTYKIDDLALSGRSVTTERLYLRPFEEGDAHAMWQMLSDPDVMRYIPRDVATDEQAEKLEFLTDLRAGRRFKFFRAVTWRDPARALNDGMLGWILTRPTLDGRYVEVGYWFRKDFWGMGLATEAGRAATKYMQEDLGVPDADLFAYVLRGNKASRNVLKKIGLEHRRDATVDGDEVWELYGPGAETYTEAVRVTRPVG